MRRIIILAATALITTSALADTLPVAGIVPPVATGIPHTCLQFYPSLALKRGEQGWTTVRIAIAQDGSIYDPILQESSGSDLLDQASLDCVKGWTYRPATRNGTPIAVLWAVRVEWYLDSTYEGPASREGRQQDPRFVPPLTPHGENHECPFSTSDTLALTDRSTRRPTVIEYTITPKGITTDHKLVRSSGNQKYDDAAMKCVTSWHYVPASRDGVPEDARWSASIPWGYSEIKPPERLPNPEPKSH